MIIVDLKIAIFFTVLIVIGIALLAIWIDRRRLRTLQPASASLRHHSLALQGALDSAPFGLIILNTQLESVYANPYACRLLSLDPPPARLPEEWHGLLQEDVASLQSQDAASGRYRVVALKPDRYIRWWTRRLHSFVLMFLTDASGQWKAEQAAHTFLGNLSHELRTPLTAILAHLEILRMPDIPSATREQSLELIRRETTRISRLVSDLLELSRLEIASEFAQRPVDILMLVEETIAEIIPGAEERQVEVTLDAGSSLPRVLGDPDRLKQVFLNIVDNAIKYSRPGDCVEICLQIEPDGVGCTIRDTGPGIPPQHLPYVTQRLYRARTDVEGSGLGLALVEEILRRHDSRLEIDSQAEGEQTGTRVRFVLPAVRTENV